MLPGLKPDRVAYPSLHLYIQQRYHQTMTGIAAGGSTIASSGSNLHYFEMFTLWISPMKLDVDEELLVKCLRYAMAIREVGKLTNHPSTAATTTAAAGGSTSSIGSGGSHAVRRGSKGGASSSYTATSSSYGVSDFTSHFTGSSSSNSKNNSDSSDLDRRSVFAQYSYHLNAGRRPYINYSRTTKSTTGIYFSLLQLHPIDIVMSYRPSQTITALNNAEIAFISIVSQLDTARLCLNALIAEHAFGTPSFLANILLKHYRNAFWRQFHKLIGSSDIVEASVGLVANLGLVANY